MALSAAQEARLVAMETTITTATAGLRADILGLKTALANATPPAAGPDPAVDAAFARLEARLAPLTALDAETPGSTPVVPVPPLDQV